MGNEYPSGRHNTQLPADPVTGSSLYSPLPLFSNVHTFFSPLLPNTYTCSFADDDLPQSARGPVPPDVDVLEAPTLAVHTRPVIVRGVAIGEEAAPP